MYLQYHYKYLYIVALAVPTNPRFLSAYFLLSLPPPPIVASYSHSSPHPPIKELQILTIQFPSLTSPINTFLSSLSSFPLPLPLPLPLPNHIN